MCGLNLERKYIRDCGDASAKFRCLLMKSMKREKLALGRVSPECAAEGFPGILFAVLWIH